jgi:hypothetical protein
MSGVEVNAVIDKLADKLAVPAGKLMELIPALGVKLIGAIFVYIGVLAVSALVFCVVFPRTYEAWTEVYSGSSLWAVGGVFAIIAVLMAVAMAIFGLFCDIPNLILWFYNPQAWALDYILKMIR